MDSLLSVGRFSGLGLVLSVCVCVWLKVQLKTEASLS